MNIRKSRVRIIQMLVLPQSDIFYLPFEILVPFQSVCTHMVLLWMVQCLYLYVCVWSKHVSFDFKQNLIFIWSCWIWFKCYFKLSFFLLYFYFFFYVSICCCKISLFVDYVLHDLLYRCVCAHCACMLGSFQWWMVTLKKKTFFFISDLLTKSFIVRYGCSSITQPAPRLTIYVLS